HAGGLSSGPWVSDLGWRGIRAGCPQRGRLAATKRRYGVPHSSSIIWILREIRDRQEGNAVESCLSRHAGAVMGRLCGFDRLVIRGTLRRLAQSSGMKAYLWATQVLLKDFGEHAQEL